MTTEIKVLLLDDSPAERELIQEAAREFGLGVNLRCVGTVPEALVELHSFAPQVTLIDLHLGALSGYDLLPWLRGSQGAVILTTTDDALQSQRCLAAGALRFWVKPLHFADFSEFFQKIRALAATP